MKRVCLFGDPEQLGTDAEVMAEMKAAEDEERAQCEAEKEERDFEKLEKKIAKRSCKNLAMRFA
jgi:hypothetical protein